MRGRKQAPSPKEGHHFGYHWHEGVGHDHEHPFAGHHGAPFGNRRVIDVADAPDLSLLLRKSIEKVEAERE